MVKKILILTYYWPPMGGSGVQRWLKFAKYLPENGWTPVIYTPSNPEMTTTDSSLANDIPPSAIIIKRPIWEPYSIYQRIARNSKKNADINPINNVESKSIKERLMLWIRANLFVPDPRCFWVNPSVRFLKKYLKEHPVNVIVTTGPPHSIHLIGKKLKSATGIPWIADFRDPWTKIFYFKHLPMCRMVAAKHRRMERSVLNSADGVITVTNVIKKELESMMTSDSGKVYLVRNGFDEEDFKTSSNDYNPRFTITHTGLLAAEGNPKILWEVLGKMVEEDAEFAQLLELRLIGKIDRSVLDAIKSNGLDKYVTQMGYIAHSEVPFWQKKSDILLLPLRNEPEAKGILTGKFFEYLAARRPILAFGPPDGELGEILSKTQSGVIFDWNDKTALKGYLSQLFSDYKNGKNNFTGNNQELQKFSRQQLTKQLVEIITQLLI